MHSINVTPLTDVLLVLLITFLLTASAFQAGPETVPLPRVAELREISAQVTSVTVGQDGTVVWPAQDLGGRPLEPAFRRLQETSSSSILALAVHRELSYQRLYPVLLAARQAGWEQIVLLTEVAP